MELQHFKDSFVRYLSNVAVEDEYLRFDRIENKYSKYPDVHAFILLDRLLSNEHNKDMIAGAEHDQIWISVDVEHLAAVSSVLTVIELIRCGVLYDNDTDSLYMFV